MTMVKAMLGRKVGMTQVFDEAGDLVPVTVLQVGPCSVVQIKHDVEGACTAVQIGYDERKKKKTTCDPCACSYCKYNLVCY